MTRRRLTEDELRVAWERSTTGRFVPWESVDAPTREAFRRGAEWQLSQPDDGYEKALDDLYELGMQGLRDRLGHWMKR